MYKHRARGRERMNNWKKRSNKKDRVVQQQLQNGWSLEDLARLIVEDLPFVSFFGEATVPLYFYVTLHTIPYIQVFSHIHKHLFIFIRRCKCAPHKKGPRRDEQIRCKNLEREQGLCGNEQAEKIQEIKKLWDELWHYDFRRRKKNLPETGSLKFVN